MESSRPQVFAILTYRGILSTDKVTAGYQLLKTIASQQELENKFQYYICKILIKVSGSLSHILCWNWIYTKHVVMSLLPLLRALSMSLVKPLKGLELLLSTKVSLATWIEYLKCGSSKLRCAIKYTASGKNLLEKKECKISH